jgi:putative ABC transport system permease protein
LTAIKTNQIGYPYETSRKFRHSLPKHKLMFKNYLKIAFRNLVRRKAYTLINVLGLSTGMAICLLIVLFIKSELSYDTSQQNGERIYRMVVDRKYPGRSTSYSLIPQSYAAAVKLECPEVEEAVRVFNFAAGGALQLSYENRKFDEKRVLLVDSNFFRVFSSKFLAGNAATALTKPHAVVITESTAKKYFGSTGAAIGKLLKPTENNDAPLEVTAVCADWPENSHFVFDMLLTTAGQPNFTLVNYVNFSAHTYLLLNPAATMTAVESKFPYIIEKHAAGNIERQFAVPFKQFQAAGNGYNYYLQPLKKIHLYSHLEGEFRPNGNIQAVYIFGIVAVFILLLACINFINLATARSVERAKEVGIRKTFGSEKKSLVAQFLTESTLLSFVSMLISAAVALLLLPLFNQISGKELKMQDLFHWQSISLLILFSLVTGLLAGIYPAFVLSSFRPITVLKGKFRSSNYGRALRNGLVVFQFSISVILIICTIVVNSQMNFMTGNDLGFTKEHTILIQRTDLLGDKTQSFKNEVLKIPGVEAISGASAFPGMNNFFGISWREKSSAEPMTGRGIVVDDQYAAALGLEMKEGRFFSREFATDSLAIVLNEKAVTELGLKNPVGAQLTTPEEFLNGTDGAQYMYTVIGVVKDFHYQSLHNAITPLVFSSASRFNNVSFVSAIRIKANAFTDVLRSLEQKWNTFVIDRPFQYEFLDKTVEAQYQAESTTQKVFSFFSSLAIFIACIGLLGLAAYATQQRMREISIRKVLGARVSGIMLMLSKDFAKLVLIASLIAFPVAWWAMHTWLQGFAYRVGLSWWIFAIAGLAALVVALLTISFQAFRAAVSNPVKTLRSE